MPKFLQTVLGTPEPLFSAGIAQLEKATGHSGVDTRLIADMTHAGHDVMRKLGLDTADSSGEEVYLALVNSVARGLVESLLVNTDYVLMSFGNAIVSFNMIDVIENAHHQLPYESQIVSHGQRSLRGELVQRYIDHPRTDEASTKEVAASIGLLPESDELLLDAGPIQQTVQPTRPFILAIGDIVTDAFIALEPDQAKVEKDDQGMRRLSMEFGSKLPYDHVDIIKAVGNSANAAVAFSRLGIGAALMAFVGSDQAGQESLDHLSAEHVDTSTISVQKGQKSNYHYVLRYDADRTILIKYEPYDYSWQTPTITPDWVYLSMISESAWQLHVDLLAYLNEHPDIKLAFQPGAFHFKWGVEKLKDIYARTHILVLNREEAATVTGLGIESIRELANHLHTLGPQIVIITDGPNGAYASGNYKLLVMPNYPDPAPPYERTGAGDAFAATIVALLAKGFSLEDALRWAPINSMSVVQKLGAQAGLIGETEIQQWLDKAPEDYYPKDFEG